MGLTGDFEERKGGGERQKAVSEGVVGKVWCGTNVGQWYAIGCIVALVVGSLAEVPMRWRWDVRWMPVVRYDQQSDAEIPGEWIP